MAEAESALPSFEIRSVRQNQSGLERYTSFDVFLDGKFHCSTRFSDFATLYETLQEDLILYKLPKFPPKKLNFSMGVFSLADSDVEERRVGLEKFFKAVFQEAKLLDNPILKKFLYDEREKYLTAHAKDVKQVINFVDGTSTVLSIKTSDKASKIKQMVCDREGMSEDCSRLFALFLVTIKTNAEIKLFGGQYPYLLARKLTTADDEDPANQTPEVHKIVLKKWVFAPIAIIRITDDRAGLKHLYHQARKDIAEHILRPDKAKLAELERLERESDMKGYMRAVRTVPGFYATYFAPCTSDYPVKNSRVIVSASTDGLCLFVLKDSTSLTGQEETISFGFDRIRRWKYVEATSTFGWEYFFGSSQEGGRWITVESEQFFDINSAIQEYVDELKRRITQPGYIFKEQDLQKEESKSKSLPAVAASPSQASPSVNPVIERPMSPPPATATSASSPAAPLSPSALTQDEERRAQASRQKSNNTFNFTFNVGDVVAPKSQKKVDVKENATFSTGIEDDDL